MAKTEVRFEWDDAGFQEILAKPEVGEVCMRAAEAIASMAGEGFEAKAKTIGAFRAGAEVYADTYDAKLAESDDKALSKAAASCRC